MHRTLDTRREPASGWFPLPHRLKRNQAKRAERDESQATRRAASPLAQIATEASRLRCFAHALYIAFKRLDNERLQPFARLAEWLFCLGP